MSLLMGPEKLPADQVAAHTLRGVTEAIRSVTGISVKTGRDSALYLEDRKVGGILTDCISDLELGRVKSYIIGIGVRYDLLLAGRQRESGAGGEITRNRVIAEIVNHVVVS